MSAETACNLLCAHPGRLAHSKCAVQRYRNYQVGLEVSRDGKSLIVRVLDKNLMDACLWTPEYYPDGTG